MGKILLFGAKDLIILAVFSVACLAVFAGVVLPFQFPIIPFGQYQVGIFPMGFALYQHNTNGPYYGVSPFNDFYVTSSGFRAPLLESKEYQDNSFKTNINQPAWRQIGLVWSNIFLNAQPSYMIENARHKTLYTAKIAENNLLLQRSTQLKDNQVITAGGITLQYFENDLVLEPQSRYYYNQISPKDLEVVEKEMYFTPQYREIPEELPDQDNFSWIVESGKIVVVNPNKPGGFMIESLPGQSILVHPVARLIEVVEQNPEKSSTQSIEIRVKNFTDLGDSI